MEKRLYTKVMAQNGSHLPLCSYYGPPAAWALLTAGASVSYFKGMMRFSIARLNAVIAAALSVLLVSCASIFSSRTPSFNISGITAEPRTNGYIFRIDASQKIGNVEAWIGEDNWLYISIPDTSVNSGQLNELTKSSVVSRVKFFRYAGSVQVTLQLTQKFDHVGVINYPGDNNVYVVLYQFKTDS